MPRFLVAVDLADGMAACCEALSRSRRLRWPGAAACAAPDPEPWILPPPWPGRESWGLRRGLGGNLHDGVASLGRRNAMASCFLLYNFSGLLCFVYEPRCPMEKLPNPTGAAFVCVVKRRGI